MVKQAKQVLTRKTPKTRYPDRVADKIKISLQTGGGASQLVPLRPLPNQQPGGAGGGRGSGRGARRPGVHGGGGVKVRPQHMGLKIFNSLIILTTHKC